MVGVGTVFEITKLEYSLTLRTLYTNAANLVAIDRYQCVRVLQARLVSVISTDDSRHLLYLPRSRQVRLFQNPVKG